MSNPPPVVTFADHIIHHALTRPQKPAIILPDRFVTYDMMAQAILRVEARLDAMALAPGALVCVALESPIRMMVVTAALFRLGHPVLPLSEAKNAAFLPLPFALFLHGPGVPAMPGRRQQVVDDDWFGGERQNLLARPPKGFPSGDAIACVLLSSGTTGRPKAISLTLDVFQHRVMSYYCTHGYIAWERLLLRMGLASAWGLTVAAHALLAGRTLVFAESPRESLHMIGLYAVDAMAASTVQLRDLVREQTREPVPCTSLRLIVTGGGLLSSAMFAEARARLCSNIVNHYGSTEAGAIASAMTDRLSEVEGATGFVWPWAAVEIVDEQDTPLPAGTDSIVRTRAAWSGAPYPPGTENPTFRGEWFYPGDIGRITEAGLLILNGRASEVINAGGVKLAPEAVEDLLGQHPAVAEVVAFGGMGESGLEELSVAIVVKAEIADSELIDWCDAHHVPLSRIVRRDTLPRSPMGKILRDQVRRESLEQG